MEKAAAKVDYVKLLKAFGKGVARGAKYAPPAIAIGAISGASLGDTAKAISGQGGAKKGAKLGAMSAAATTTLAAAALEILKDPKLRKRLNPDDAALRVYNYLHAMTLEAQLLARACGKTNIHSLEPEDMAALTMEASALAKVPLAGTNHTVGVEDFHKI